jgi:hypothetical protein
MQYFVFRMIRYCKDQVKDDEMSREFRKHGRETEGIHGFGRKILK